MACMSRNLGSKKLKTRQCGQHFQIHVRKLFVEYLRKYSITRSILMASR